MIILNEIIVVRIAGRQVTSGASFNA